MNLKTQLILLGLLLISSLAESKMRHSSVHGSMNMATEIEKLRTKYSIKTNDIKALKLFVSLSKQEGSHVKFGADPKKDVSIGIDNVAAESWVAKKGCKDKKTNQPFHANPLGSSTSLQPEFECKGSCKAVLSEGKPVAKTLAIHSTTMAGGITVSGNVVKDKIELGKYTVADVPIVEVTEVSDGHNLHSLGGLSFALAETSVPNALKAKKIITHSVWSHYFFRLHDKPATLNSKATYDDIGRGFMTLGETLPIPAKHWETHSVKEGTSNWILGLAAATLGAKDVFTTGDSVILTTNHQSLTVPQNVLKTVKDEILAKGGFAASDCTADLNDFSCNSCKAKAGNLPTFHFKFGAAQHTWDLKPEDYAYFESADKCAFRIKSSGFDNIWSLGHYFFKRHYMAFDQDNKQVKLAVFPQSDLEILTGFYAEKIWAGAFGLFTSLMQFFGVVSLAFVLFK